MPKQTITTTLTRKDWEALLSNRVSQMINEVEYCQGCAYNTSKTKGGYGKLCNGLTIKNYERCPEWRINEVIKANEYTGINKLRKEVALLCSNEQK